MITIILGSNSFAVDQELLTRTKAFAEKHGDLAIERLDGEEASFEQMQASLESAPFLSAKKLVILRRPSANKQFAESFEDVLERVTESTDLLIVETKVDKRSSYYKLLKKQKDLVDCSEVESRDLPAWLVAFARQQGGMLSPTDARYLVDRLGPSQQLLRSEVDKLLLYSSDITRDNIDTMTELTPQSTVFQLVEAVFSGKAKRAIELYEEQRLQKVEPIVIMGMLAWQLHILAIVKAAGNRNSAEIAKDAKLNPYVVQKTQNIASNMTLAEVKKLINEVVLLDSKLKSVTIDADDAIKQLFIDIAAR